MGGLSLLLPAWGLLQRHATPRNAKWACVRLRTAAYGLRTVRSVAFTAGELRTCHRVSHRVSHRRLRLGPYPNALSVSPALGGDRGGSPK